MLARHRGDRSPGLGRLSQDPLLLLQRADPPRCRLRRCLDRRRLALARSVHLGSKWTRPLLLSDTQHHSSSASKRDCQDRTLTLSLDFSREYTGMQLQTTYRRRRRATNCQPRRQSDRHFRRDFTLWLATADLELRGWDPLGVGPQCLGSLGSSREHKEDNLSDFDVEFRHRMANHDTPRSNRFGNRHISLHHNHIRKTCYSNVRNGFTVLNSTTSTE